MKEFCYPAEGMITTGAIIMTQCMGVFRGFSGFKPIRNESVPVIRERDKVNGSDLHKERQDTRLLLSGDIERGMKGMGKRGRLRQMMADGMMADGYGKLKEEAQQREEWRRHTVETA